MNTRQSAIDLTKRYVEIVKQQIPGVKEAYLFGSYSHGTQKPWSDIDVAIIADEFGVDRFTERIRISKYRPNKEYWIIEPHPIGLSDFQHNDSDPFIRDVKRGIRIV
ncbi:MAG: nucleotidyltransferase domain-containing protein [Candidatus Roizmanbacteria bacterium]